MVSAAVNMSRGARRCCLFRGTQTVNHGPLIGLSIEHGVRRKWEEKYSVRIMNSGAGVVLLTKARLVVSF